MKVARRLRSDHGAMLIFALIIVTTVALVTVALLAKGWSNFAATASLRQVAGNAYAADDAAKLAINDLVWGGSSTVPTTNAQGSTPAGTCGNPAVNPVACYPNGVAGTPASWVFDANNDGAGCFGKDAPTQKALNQLTFPNVYPAVGSAAAQTATVVCTPVAGTGLFAPGPHGHHNLPTPPDPLPITPTTLGTGTSGTAVDGITLTPLGGGGNLEIPIQGSIESKTFINVTSGLLRTEGSVACNSFSGTIIYNSGTTSQGSGCSGSFATPAPPNPVPLTAVPAWKNPTTQGCNFQPGYYNNGSLLSTAVNACSTAYFASGKYYFDFVDGAPLDVGAGHNSSNPLTLIAGNAVAGHSIPGACVSPIDDDTTAGAQFVFGGSSKMKIEDNSQVEICGPGNGGDAPLTIYQQQALSTSSAATVGPVVATDCPACSPPVAGVSTQPNHAQTDAFIVSSGTLTSALSTSGGTSAGWIAGGNNHDGELDLQNFPGLSSIPVGSTITSALLKVTYSTNVGFGGTLAAGVSSSGATTPLAASGSDTDITTLLGNQFASGAFSSTNPVIQLKVGGGTAHNDSVTVDAATLTVTYAAPVLRPATVGQFIYEQGGNFAGKFVVEGSTYAPQGYINLVPGSGSNALISFRWGVVAWGVNFKSQPSQPWGYPLIMLPDSGPGQNDVTDVDLKVYLCNGAGPCPTGGAPALTTRVALQDGTDVNDIVRPVAGQRRVEVLSWAEQR